MNERIKQLMLEAGYAAPEIAGRANKLAELVVKECVRVVDDTLTENQEMNIGLVMASAAIVSHFGVEE